LTSAEKKKEKKRSKPKPRLGQGSSIFWDADGVIHMDFHAPGITINSALHCNIQNFETTTKKSSAAPEHFAGA
jgi:hypothetical protein